MEKYKLFDAEQKFMNIIWDNEPINSTELSNKCFHILGWKKSTTYNMIRKLSEKGFLQNNSAIVISLIKRNEIQKYESHNIIQNTFNGSLPAFLTAFLEQKKITKEEANELRRIIEEAKND